MIKDHGVEVKAPIHVSDAYIQKFVDSKQEWIARKLKEYESYDINLRESHIYLWGEKLEVVPIRMNDIYRVDEGKLYIRADMKLEKVTSHLIKKEKQILQQYLTTKVSYYAYLLGVDTPTFQIRIYKRLYGRCNSRNELGFNTYLIKEKLAFIDYVVLHECAHIIEFNHSKAFYALIENIMPNYKEVIRHRRI